MVSSACSACGRVGRVRRGLCDAHYFRLWRTGSVGPAEVALKQPGATCTVAGCAAPHSALGYCHTHYTRHRRHGDPTVVKTPAPRRGAANSSWTGDLASYSAVHMRVRVALGPASARMCGCGARAEEWAYDHSDPNGRVDPKSGMRYSTDIARYMPMCATCHRRMDDNPIARRRAKRTICTAIDCDRVSKSKGLCDMHYLRALRARKKNANQ